MSFHPDGILSVRFEPENVAEYSTVSSGVQEEIGLIKIVTGVRRSGKSYLLGTLFRRRLNEDGVKYKNGETILEFAKSGADADGGKFTMTVSMDITGEEDGMEISASIDVVAPGKWRVESNDIEVTYNSADMKFNIKKLDLKPSGDADSETMMAFALAKEAGMLDEDVLKEAVLQSIQEEVGDAGEVTTDKLGLVSVSGDVLEFNDEDLGKVKLTKVQ